MAYLAQGTKLDFNALNGAIGLDPKLSGIGAIGAIVSKFLTYLFPFAGILLFLYLVMGGFAYLTSAGDPKAMEKAQGQITNAIIGFVIIFVAFWLVQILEFVFGLKGGLFGA